MGITLTKILGTDSISGSRLTINDNFQILKEEINAIETYIDPDAGTIDGLNSITTDELKVGPVSNYSLEITHLGFNINTDLNLTKNLHLNGIVSNSSFAIIDEGTNLSPHTVDLINGFANYSIIHTSTGDYVIELDEGYPGQEVNFFVEQKGGGDIIIKPATGETFIVDDIIMKELGSTLTLKCVLNSNNDLVWYVLNKFDPITTT